METGEPPWTIDGAGGFNTSLPSAASAPREARRHTQGLADVLPPEALADLRTVLTELVANCVQHGPGADIEVTVDVTGAGYVRGRVSDGSDGRVAIAPPRGPGDGGLGLRIVDAIASRWGVEAPSTAVWFELVPAV